VTGSGWSRREFTALSAATVGALLTGRSGRAVEQTAMTDRYEFLAGAVETAYQIPTLVQFTDRSGFDSLAGLDTEFRTHPEEPVAHAGLTPAQAETVARVGTAERLEYAPGSNPFWPLGEYEAGVFPDPGDSAGFVALEEAVAGLEHLAAEHPDRLRVETVGAGHGHRNRYTGDQDPQPVWVAELTENVDAAEGRETVVFVASVHGDERAGVEASLRFIEDVLTGARPGIADLLSERRLVFACPNPDGWVVDERLYENPVDPPDFRRFNGANRDLNREQPSPGWIRPDRRPGEPLGADLVDDAPGPDEDVPDQVATAVPETLSLVERLRSYDDVAYLVDLHGMYGHTNAVLGIETGGGTPADRADSDLLTRAIGARVEEAVGPLADWTDAFEAAAADSAQQVGDPEECDPDLLCEQPVELFGSGTGLDTIQYTVSGGLAGWAGAPERLGGLGATPLTLEVVFSNSLREGMEVRFVPDIVEFQVRAYGAVCAATVEHAVDEVDATVETGGRSTAYLAADDLRRRASDLPHVEPGTTPVAGGVTVGPADETTLAGSGPKWSDSTLATDSHHLAGGDVETTVDIPPGTHTLTVALRAPGGRVTGVTLRDGGGTAVEDVAGSGDRSTPGRTVLTALDPDPGRWRVEGVATAPVEVRVTRLVADEVPDPRRALGYAQRDYTVTPLTALEALDSAADGPVEAVTAAELGPDTLLTDGRPTYDNLVLTHDHGVDEAARAALAAYVEAGGNLVLTDSGVGLAAALDVAGLDGVGADDVVREELAAAAYPDPDADHPLVAGRRTFDAMSSIERREPWRHPPLGYARNEVPMHTVTAGRLRAAGATVAAAVDGRARLATVPTDGERVGIHLLGSLLPPAAQHNLHPFGLRGQSLTRLGYLLLCNALGYRLSFSRNGDQVTTLGSLVGTDNGTGGTGSGDGDGSTDDGTGGTPDDSGGGTDDGTGGTPDDSAGDGTGGQSEGGADGDGPGFGVAAGVAGLGGLGYLLSRRAGDSGAEGE
jgi:PGF-CTERM protein